MKTNNNKIRDHTITKWWTINEYYDRDTGEQITGNEIKNYIIINKTIDYEFTETNYGKKTGIKKITNECWRSEQLKIKL